MAYALKEIGPSIFCAAFCEALAFFIGMLTDVPALWSFCLVAGIAVIVDFILQITMFIACLSMDVRRIQQNKYDIAFCLSEKEAVPPRIEFVRAFFAKYFVPFLFNKLTKILVFVLTALLFVQGVCSCIKI